MPIGPAKASATLEVSIGPPPPPPPPTVPTMSWLLLLLLLGGVALAVYSERKGYRTPAKII